MFCPDCGQEVKDSSINFCSECGFQFKKSKQTEYITYESVQMKSVSDLEKALSASFKLFAGYGVIHAVVSLFINHGFSPTSLRIVLLMFLIAAGSFILAVYVSKKSPITEHFKFKCPRCNEENIIPADAETAFECKKCQKKFIVVENNIKIID